MKERKKKKKKVSWQETAQLDQWPSEENFQSPRTGGALICQWKIGLGNGAPQKWVRNDEGGQNIQTSSYKISPGDIMYCMVTIVIRVLHTNINSCEDVKNFVKGICKD